MIQLPLDTRADLAANTTTAMDLVKIAFDGGCRGNPGSRYGSFGVKLGETEILKRVRVEFGFGTNNEAEFLALETALNQTLDHFLNRNLNPRHWQLLVFTDSTIVRNRLQGKKRATVFRKHEESSNRMIEHAARCLKMMIEFQSFSVVWQGRENNVALFGH